MIMPVKHSCGLTQDKLTRAMMMRLPSLLGEFDINALHASWELIVCYCNAVLLIARQNRDQFISCKLLIRSLATFMSEGIK